MPTKLLEDIEASTGLSASFVPCLTHQHVDIGELLSSKDLLTNSLVSLRQVDVEDSSLPPHLLRNLQLVRELRILRLRSCRLQSIDFLCLLPKLEYVDVSKNEVQHIPVGIRDVEPLRHLDLSFNQIANFQEVLHLAANVKLVELFLRGNLISTADYYRLHMIGHFPKLLFLDGEEVRDSDQRAAKRFLEGSHQSHSLTCSAAGGRSLSLTPPRRASHSPNCKPFSGFSFPKPSERGAWASPPGSARRGRGGGDSGDSGESVEDAAKLREMLALTQKQLQERTREASDATARLANLEREWELHKIDVALQYANSSPPARQTEPPLLPPETPVGGSAGGTDSMPGPSGALGGGSEASRRHAGVAPSPIAPPASRPPGGSRIERPEVPRGGAGDPLMVGDTQDAVLPSEAGRVSQPTGEGRGEPMRGQGSFDVTEGQETQLELSELSDGSPFTVSARRRAVAAAENAQWKEDGANRNEGDGPVPPEGHAEAPCTDGHAEAPCTDGHAEAPAHADTDQVRESKSLSVAPSHAPCLSPGAPTVAPPPSSANEDGRAETARCGCAPSPTGGASLGFRCLSIQLRFSDGGLPAASGAVRTGGGGTGARAPAGDFLSLPPPVPLQPDIDIPVPVDSNCANAVVHVQARHAAGNEGGGDGQEKNVSLGAAAAIPSGPPASPFLSTPISLRCIQDIHSISPRDSPGPSPSRAAATQGGSAGAAVVPLPAEYRDIDSNEPLKSSPLECTEQTGTAERESRKQKETETRKVIDLPEPDPRGLQILKRLMDSTEKDQGEPPRSSTDLRLPTGVTQSIPTGVTRSSDTFIRKSAERAGISADTLLSGTATFGPRPPSVTTAPCPRGQEEPSAPSALLRPSELAQIPFGVRGPTGGVGRGGTNDSTGVKNDGTRLAERRLQETTGVSVRGDGKAPGVRSPCPCVLQCGFADGGRGGEFLETARTGSSSSLRFPGPLPGPALLRPSALARIPTSPLRAAPQPFPSLASLNPPAAFEDRFSTSAGGGRTEMPPQSTLMSGTVPAPPPVLIDVHSPISPPRRPHNLRVEETRTADGYADRGVDVEGRRRGKEEAAEHFERCMVLWEKLSQAAAAYVETLERLARNEDSCSGERHGQEGNKRERCPFSILLKLLREKRALFEDCFEAVNGKEWSTLPSPAELPSDPQQQSLLLDRLGTFVESLELDGLEALCRDAKLVFEGKETAERVRDINEAVSALQSETENRGETAESGALRETLQVLRRLTVLRRQVARQFLKHRMLFRACAAASSSGPAGGQFVPSSSSSSAAVPRRAPFAFAGGQGLLQREGGDRTQHKDKDRYTITSADVHKEEQEDCEGRMSPKLHVSLALSTSLSHPGSPPMLSITPSPGRENVRQRDHLISNANITPDDIPSKFQRGESSGGDVCVEAEVSFSPLSRQAAPPLERPSAAGPSRGGGAGPSSSLFGWHGRDRERRGGESKGKAAGPSAVGPDVDARGDQPADYRFAPLPPPQHPPPSSLVGRIQRLSPAHPRHLPEQVSGWTTAERSLPVSQQMPSGSLPSVPTLNFSHPSAFPSLQPPPQTLHITPDIKTSLSTDVLGASTAFSPVPRPRFAPPSRVSRPEGASPPPRTSQGPVTLAAAASASGGMSGRQEACAALSSRLRILLSRAEAMQTELLRAGLENEGQPPVQSRRSRDRDVVRGATSSTRRFSGGAAVLVGTPVRGAGAMDSSRHLRILEERLDALKGVERRGQVSRGISSLQEKARRLSGVIKECHELSDVLAAIPATPLRGSSSQSLHRSHSGILVPTSSEARGDGGIVPHGLHHGGGSFPCFHTPQPPPYRASRGSSPPSPSDLSDPPMHAPQRPLRHGLSRQGGIGVRREEGGELARSFLGSRNGGVSVSGLSRPGSVQQPQSSSFPAGVGVSLRGSSSPPRSRRPSARRVPRDREEERESEQGDRAAGRHFLTRPSPDGVQGKRQYNPRADPDRFDPSSVHSAFFLSMETLSHPSGIKSSRGPMKELRERERENQPSSPSGGIPGSGSVDAAADDDFRRIIRAPRRGVAAAPKKRPGAGGEGKEGEREDSGTRASTPPRFYLTPTFHVGVRGGGLLGSRANGKSQQSRNGREEGTGQSSSGKFQGQTGFSRAESRGGHQAFHSHNLWSERCGWLHTSDR
uniref:Leucine rich repeat-containing protein n=1 Tax=Chromera velia CCMP2878 TaxID=1169474 RepID=A0A0G4I9U0_9ALVE|eukprot:Cvel_12264.t1-p1 / transcript=Cvel_12264.t1 / gene=Cvel_12264 / organism=Chromera_velia_CCMP2878 / gene_product=Protein TILB homolog, putative / transcript_product=Protein TILB homolog, putative / location=Cvel_scaffold794:40002-48723(+) / protein_length=2151 / sequence_SO=supercontig / SO=protein_coding / is_pseudo=false